MYVELACLDKTVSLEETRKTVFAASELHLNGVVMLPAYVSEMKEYLPDLVVACPVDYPNGTSDTKIRNHEVLNSIRKGANTIDLVMNHTMVVNKQMEKLMKDVESNFAICKDNNVTLRIQLEYRIYPSGQVFFDVVELLQGIGIEYVFPSTGYRIDIYSDNLIAAKGIAGKSDIKVISNGNVVSQEQYDIVKKSGVYGVRFNSIRVAQSLFGV